MVVASLESNLRVVHQQQLGNISSRLGLLSRTEGWLDDASIGMMRRQETLFGGSLAARSGCEAPLLVTLPYPTGLVSAVSFATSVGEYRADRRRPIAVLMLGHADRGKKAPDATAWRTRLVDLMTAAGAQPLLATPYHGSTMGGARGPTSAVGMCAEGARCSEMQWHSLYDQTADAAFCLQARAAAPTP